MILAICTTLMAAGASVMAITAARVAQDRRLIEAIAEGTSDLALRVAALERAVNLP